MRDGKMKFATAKSPRVGLLSGDRPSRVQTHLPGDELLSQRVVVPGSALVNAPVTIQEFIRHLISSFGLGLGVPVLWVQAGTPYTEYPVRGRPHCQF